MNYKQTMFAFLAERRRKNRKKSDGEVRLEWHEYL